METGEVLHMDDPSARTGVLYIRIIQSQEDGYLTANVKFKIVFPLRFDYTTFIHVFQQNDNNDCIDWTANANKFLTASERLIYYDLCRRASMNQQKLFQRVVAVILIFPLLVGCNTFLPQPTSTPTSISTETVIPTLTHTVSSTPFPSITPSPLATKTSTPQPEWVTAFAQPIMDAIADRPPDFQDDFSQSSIDWQYEMKKCKNDGCVFSDGTLSLSTAPENGKDSWAVITIPCSKNFETFALTVDIDISQLTDDNAAGFGYDNLKSKFAFEIKNSGRWWMFMETGPGDNSLGILSWPVPEIIKFTIIVRHDNLAVYLNDIPITTEEFSPAILDTNLTLRAYSGGTTSAIVAYDNLKIWNLDIVPDIP
jgi:hypothetical protein